MTGIVLTDFRPLDPAFEISQVEFRERLVAALEPGDLGGSDPAAWVDRYTVSPQSIAARRFEVPSVYTRGPAADGFEISESALDVRMRIFDEAASSVFRRLYPIAEEAPDDIVHVTCSGYVSPSPAQRLVSERGWSSIVTHSYHMGCAGAFPAVRTASGYLAAGALYGGKRRIDVVHTELLSVHATSTRLRLDPEGLVLRSLFGDGLIRYSLIDESALPAEQSGLKILALHEQILPDSLDDMTWRLVPEKFVMTLSNRVPFAIAEHIEAFARMLAARAGREFDEWREDMVFAIHPGGPKIVDLVQKFLDLEDWQVRHSRQVLLEHGNMSSATVPHIWKRIVADKTLAEGTLVLGVGFGPGLGAHGMLAEKV
jgi:alkylresorcinol/alkylpyrone synthase